MMDKPDPSAVLVAAELEEIEAQIRAGETPPEFTGITLEQATKALRRIRYHEAQKAEVKAQADAMVAHLQAEIDQVNAWLREGLDARDQSIAYHQSLLVAYYRQYPPIKGKTLKLPGGR